MKFRWSILYCLCVISGMIYSEEVIDTGEEPTNGDFTMHRISPSQPGSFPTFMSTAEITSEIALVDVSASPGHAFDLLAKLERTPSAHSLIPSLEDKITSQVEEAVKNLGRDPEQIFNLLAKLKQIDNAAPEVTLIEKNITTLIKIAMVHFDSGTMDTVFSLLENWSGNVGAEDYLQPLREHIQKSVNDTISQFSSNPKMLFEQLQKLNEVAQSFSAAEPYADQLHNVVEEVVSQIIQDKDFPFEKSALVSSPAPQWATILRVWSGIEGAQPYVNEIVSRITEAISAVLVSRITNSSLIHNALSDLSQAPDNLLTRIETWKAHPYLREMSTYAQEFKDILQSEHSAQTREYLTREFMSQISSGYADPVLKTFFRILRSDPTQISTILARLSNVLPTDPTELAQLNETSASLSAQLDAALLQYKRSLPPSLAERREMLLDEAFIKELQRQKVNIDYEDEEEEPAQQPVKPVKPTVPVIEEPQQPAPEDFTTLLQDFSTAMQGMQRLVAKSTITALDAMLKTITAAVDSSDPLEQQEALENGRDFIERINDAQFILNDTDNLLVSFQAKSQPLDQVIHNWVSKTIENPVNDLIAGLDSSFPNEWEDTKYAEPVMKGGQLIVINREAIFIRKLMNELAPNGRSKLDNWLEAQGFSDPLMRSEVTNLIKMVVAKSGTLQSMVQSVFKMFNISDTASSVEVRNELHDSSMAATGSRVKSFYESFSQTFTPLRLLMERLLKNPELTAYQQSAEPEMFSKILTELQSLLPTKAFLEAHEAFREMQNTWNQIEERFVQQPETVLQPTEIKADVSSAQPSQVNEMATLLVNQIMTESVPNVTPEQAAQLPNLLEELNELLAQKNIPEEKRAAVEDYRVAVTWAMMEDAAQRATNLLARAKSGFSGAGPAEVTGFRQDAEAVKASLDKASALYTSYIIPLPTSPVLEVINNSLSSTAQQSVAALGSSLASLKDAIEQAIPSEVEPETPLDQKQEQEKDKPTVPQEPSLDQPAKESILSDLVSEHLTGKEDLNEEERTAALVSWLEMSEEINKAENLITRVKAQLIRKNDNQPSVPTDLTPEELRASLPRLNETSTLFESYSTGKKKLPSEAELAVLKEQFDTDYKGFNSPTINELAQRLSSISTELSELATELEAPSEKPVPTKIETQEPTRPKTETTRSKQWWQVEKDINDYMEQLKQNDINSKSGFSQLFTRFNYWFNDNIMSLFKNNNINNLITSVNNLIDTVDTNPGAIRTMEIASLKKLVNDLTIYVTSMGLASGRQDTQGFDQTELDAFTNNVIRLKMRLDNL